MLAHRAVEGEQVLDDGGGVGELLDLAGGAVDDARRELVPRSVGDHPGVRLVPDPQAVFGEQPAA